VAADAFSRSRMRVSLYLDENAMDSGLVQALRNQGIDVTTVQDAERRGASDEQQLAYATEQGRVIYSYNVKDFMVLHSRLLEQEQSHAGIILAHERGYGIGEQARRLIRIADVLSAEDMRDQLAHLSSWG
jgi:predicted nuclease of predicted toxin-antitoxin system